MLETLGLSILCSAVLALMLTPLAIRLAIRMGAVDKPDERKIHKRPMPRMGGLAPFLSFVVTLVILNFVAPDILWTDPFIRSRWLIVAVSLLAILVLGVCDDLRSLKPGQKFFVQFLAGALVYAAGFRIHSITNPLSGGMFHLGLAAFPFTVMWVVGITNAFNLIDGLDGLAAGIAVIASTTMAAIAFLHHDVTTAAIAVALAGSVLGFLRYNFNPAKVFLGDSGSLFLGFTLAILSIQSSTKGSTAFSVLVPLLALGVPVMDTILAMSRRILRSLLPDQSAPSTSLRKLHSMFLPDRRHIHHQLLACGLSHREAVFVLYLVSCTFGFCAFLVTAGSLNASLILAAVAMLAVFAVRRLGYKEMALLRNGLLLRLYKKTFATSVVAQAILDVCAIIASYLLASLVSSNRPGLFADWRNAAYPILATAAVQLLGFLKGGLYRRTIDLLGLGDLLQILKSAFWGTLVASFLIWLFPIVREGLHPVMFPILDFYFVATFVIGSRVAFHVMNYIFRRDVTDGRKVLIYGADQSGLLTLQSLLSGKPQEQRNNVSVTPVGFLDDNPDMEGKLLDGYPVFGGHWKLEGLMNRMHIDEIVLSSQDLSSASFHRVRKIADEHRVPVRVSQLKLEPVSIPMKDVRYGGAGNGNGSGFIPNTAGVFHHVGP